MATIKKVEEFKKANNKKTWKFTMDDGTQGYSHPNNPEKPWEYKEGDEVGVKVENKGTYNLLIFTRNEASPPPPASTVPTSIQPPPAPKSVKAELSPRELAEFKVQLRRDVIKTIGEVAAAGRIEPKDMPEFFNNFYLATDASIDELCK